MHALVDSSSLFLGGRKKQGTVILLLLAICARLSNYSCISSSPRTECLSSFLEWVVMHRWVLLSSQDNFETVPFKSQLQCIKSRHYFRLNLVMKKNARKRHLNDFSVTEVNASLRCFLPPKSLWKICRVHPQHNSSTWLSCNIKDWYECSYN